MPNEIKWSDPIKAAQVDDSVPKEPGVYQVCVKTPKILLSVGTAGASDAEGLLGRIKLHCSQNEADDSLAKYLQSDVEVGAVFGFDVKMQDHRQGFLSRDCYFLVHPMPNASQEEIDEAKKTLEVELKPRYMGKVGVYKGIEW